MLVSCVLRRSIAFNASHVYWLDRQIKKFMPGRVFVPFSDVPLDIPHMRLETTWPSWWAKMEAYSKLTEGPVLMLDIDTVLVKQWDGIEVPAGKAYMPTFPNRTDKVFGSWQLSSPEFRAEVVDHFSQNPEKYFDETKGCDQEYYRKYWQHKVLSLRSVSPDLCASYPLQVRPHGLFQNTAFVLFHGLPRPWRLDLPWIPKLEETAC